MVKDIKVVGLTGGIGTGKSTAAQIFKDKGFYHIDADQIGRDITVDGSPMLPVLDEIFGPEGKFGRPGVDILDGEGRLDRKALASIVFTDAAGKAELDRIMFREIVSRIGMTIDGIKRDAAEGRNDELIPAGILIDAPLLFEAGLDSRCDVVVLLVADTDIRIQRVCMRDGATEEEVRNRINSQMSDEDKRKRAHVIIDNSGTKKELEKQIEKFFAEFSKNSCNHFNAVL